MTKRIRMEDLPEEYRRRVEAQYATLLLVCYEQALRGLHHIDRAIATTEPYKPVDTGLYRASFAVDRFDKGADVGSDAPYAPVIEYGSRPHRVPYQVLYQWALRKFRVWGDGTAKTPEEREDDAVAIAKGTQRNIAKFGTKPRWVQSRALPPMKRDLGRAIKRLRNRPGFERPK